MQQRKVVRQATQLLLFGLLSVVAFESVAWGDLLIAPVSGKPPIVGPVRPYDKATNARIPGYDNHHLDPKQGRVDPDYPKGPTIAVRNDNAGGRVPGGINLHTAKGGFQTALNDHIKKDLGFTIKQWNDLPDATVVFQP